MKPDKSSSIHLDDEAINWATRLDGGDLSPAELAVLDAWLASDPSHPWRLAHYQQFYAQLHGTLPAIAETGAAGLQVRLGPTWWRRGRTWATLGVAAGLAIAAVTWVRRPQRIETLAGHRQSVTLADGSRADVNAQTRLSVRMDHSRRIVELEQGEAVFTVTKNPNRPFFVETSAGIVRVTGTVFDVRRVATGALEVTVLEGTVAVRPRDAAGRELPTPRPLTAGDQLVFNPATAALRLSRPASVEDVVAWREGKLVFDGTPLGEALERFASYHGRVITVAPEVAELQLGGRYSLDDLDQFIVSLERALPVHVFQNGDGSLRVVPVTRQP